MSDRHQRDEAARKQIEEEEWRFLVKRAISELTGEVRRVADELGGIRHLLAEWVNRLPDKGE
jgi:hypothetical protein